jgi:prepilin-type N-terminal cleavage/methylation domain-containing protein/prepilin-type processing-associated H-X9-DG protein
MEESLMAHTTWTARGLRGFTLVELLVVIGIIAVLTAILFPVLAGARGKARQLQCASHVRQITQAMLTYASEYGDHLPPATYERPASRFTLPWQPVININWWDIMLPCLGDSVDLLYCPSRTTYVPPYFMNQNLGAPENGYLDDVTQPTETYLVVEAWPPDEHNKLPLAAPVAFCIYPSSDHPLPHFGRANASFVDGHLKALSIEAFSPDNPLWVPWK